MYLPIVFSSPLSLAGVRAPECFPTDVHSNQIGGVLTAGSDIYSVAVIIGCVYVYVRWCGHSLLGVTGLSHWFESLVLVTGLLLSLIL